jgi:hypothetical protein
VAVGDVAELVRDDALDFIGVVGGLDESGVDVDGLAAGDERVDRIVVDQDDFYVAGREASCLDERVGHLREHGFGFGVAENRLCVGGLRPQEEGGGRGCYEALHIGRYRRS